jgi:hypothetical protein
LNNPPEHLSSFTPFQGNNYDEVDGSKPEEVFDARQQQFYEAGAG